MAPFDRSLTTSYQSAIISTTLSCTIFEIFDIEEYCDLEIRVRGHSPYKFMHDVCIAEIYIQTRVNLFCL